MFRMDKDKNQTLDSNEFIVAFLDRRILCNKTNMSVFFKEMDKKKQDALTLSDLKQALPALATDNQITLQQMMQQFNLDSQGRITLTEFNKIMIYK